MKAIGIIIKKELKRYFTDIRMIIGILLPGLLIFCLYSVMGNFINQEPTIDTEYKIYAEYMPEEIKSALSKQLNIHIMEELEDESHIFEQLENQEIELYIVFPQNFMQDIQEQKDNVPQVKIFYNSASSASLTIYQMYRTFLDNLEAELANRFDINTDLNVKYDFAKEEDITIRIFTMMLPFLLITFLFSGAMGICAESISGEKERGTIATLLVTPVKRSYIAIGKVSALGITALASSLISFIGLIASLPRLVGTNLSLAAYNISTIFMLLGIIILTVLLFTVVLTLVSTFAKSVKEASSLSIPVMIVVMLLGATSFMGTTAQTNPALYLIPVYGAIQSLTGILSLSINPLCFSMCVLSSVVYIALGIFALTKMFNSERIMFNS